ncbi:MAG: LLM class flavin-dependent oxidoreductase [Myxococcales bacterium]|nr:LLM class flavin-dependent oxidoreductase [Myxococcales bacterium]MDD9971049.1 LLM class flavin-dependent oxidoreductase [Myxococcales bacterium]
MARRISMGFNWQGELDRDAAYEAAQIADEVGVDSMWVAEAWGRDAFSLLTLVADRTKRVKLGTSIVNIYSRTPGALAQHFGTLDELSGGRVIIGLGTSGIRVIEHFHGVPFQPAYTRLKETVELLRLFFANEPVHYDGKLFKLERGFRLRFDPVRKQVPIYLATLKPKSVRFTAEKADGWMPTMIPFRDFPAESRKVRAWCSEAGKDPDAFTIRCPGSVTVANDDEAYQRARYAAASGLAFYCARMGDYYYEQLCGFGFQAEADAVRAAWKDGGAAAGIGAVDDGLLEQMHFIGTTEACAERLHAQEEAGANLHSVRVMEGDPEKRGRILERLIG